MIKRVALVPLQERAQILLTPGVVDDHQHVDGLESRPDRPAPRSDTAVQARSRVVRAVRFLSGEKVGDFRERKIDIMAEIVAKRLVEHLECLGFVVMKRPA